MINVAIVEDEDSQAQVLYEYIERYSRESGSKYSYKRFRDGYEFIENYRQEFGVVLLDINMPHLNGMDAAVMLREKDKNVSIVFITSLVQFALRGYEVDAVSFMKKPVSYYDFALKFRKAVDVYLMNEERSFTVNTPGGLCRISTDKLMYVEILNHRLYYHLVDDVIEMTGVLASVEKELEDYGFLRCSSAFLVNPKFIRRIQGQTVIVGDREISISRLRKAEFMSRLANWYAGQGR